MTSEDAESFRSQIPIQTHWEKKSAGSSVVCDSVNASKTIRVGEQAWIRKGLTEKVTSPTSSGIYRFQFEIFNQTCQLFSSKPPRSKFAQVPPLLTGVPNFR